MSLPTVLNETAIKGVAPSLYWHSGWASDVDSCYSEGIYQTGPTTQGLPSGGSYGILRVTSVADMRMQEFFSLSSSQNFFRIVNGSGTKAYPAWRKVSLEVLT